MPITLVNPLDETLRVIPKPAKRLAGLSETTIGLLDISKPGGSVFLNHLERLLKERYSVGKVVRIIKPTFTKPAPQNIIEELLNSKCDAVIEALAD